MKKYIIPIVIGILVFGLLVFLGNNNNRSIFKGKMSSVIDQKPTIQEVSEANNSEKTLDEDVFRTEKVVLAEGEKISDVLKKFGMTDKDLIERLLVKFNSETKIKTDLDKESKTGDVIIISLHNDKITKIIIKLSDGRKYILLGEDFNMNFSRRWKVDSASKKDVHLVEKSHNFVGDSQYFYVYIGKDKSKKHLDTIVSSIMSSLNKRESFDLYDDYNAALIAYIDWSSALYAEKLTKLKFQKFYAKLEQCYNYQLEHLLVSSDNYGNIIFSNYELNEKYRENLRSGIYKECDPDEFIDNYEDLIGVLEFDNALGNALVRFIREKKGKECQELIRSKYRYVNSLVFEDKLDVDRKDNVYNITGILKVESTNGDRAKQTYSCVYDSDKKEFIDWSVGKLNLIQN